MSTIISIKSKILAPWSLMRIVRLILGIGIIIQSFMNRNFPMMMIGFGFMLMPILNLGCGCAGSSCITDKTKIKDE